MGKCFSGMLIHWITLFISLTAVVFFSPTSMADAIDRPHFYQVTKGKESHYLLGTYHLAVHWEDFPDEVHRAFERQSHLILETLYADKMRRLLTVNTDNMALPKTTLSEAHKDKIRRLGISDKLFPKSVHSSCFMLLQYPLVGKYPFYLLDADLFFRAKDSGKKIFKLDHPEILKNAKLSEPTSPKPCTVGSILNNLSVESILNISRKGFDAYRNGPNGYVIPENPSVAYRNKAWMPEIIRILRSNNSFIAVGANHLYGNNGLIKLLRDEGYQVRLTLE